VHWSSDQGGLQQAAITAASPSLPPNMKAAAATEQPAPPDSTQVYASSSARRFVVNTDGLTADSLYLVLRGNKTVQQLRGETLGTTYAMCG